MNAGPFPMGRLRFAALASILTFGLTSLFAVLGGGVLAPLTFVLGFFVVVPLALLLGDDFPGVGSEPEASAETEHVVSRDPDDQMERLRDRYARGEIDEAEFERGVEQLLETKDLERQVDADVGRQREFDLE